MQIENNVHSDFIRTKQVLARIQAFKSIAGHTESDLSELASLRGELLRLCPASRFLWFEGQPVVDLAEIIIQAETEREEMQKSYKKIIIDAEAITKKIGDFQQRIDLGAGEIQAAKGKRSDLVQQRRDALVAGDMKKVGPIETEIKKVGTKIDRSVEEVDALREGLAMLQEEASNIENERKQAFADLAERWLKEEVMAYNKAATEAIQRIRRMSAVAQKLHDTGKMEAFRQALGRYFNILPSAKIPILGEGLWRPETMDKSIARFSTKTMDGVLNEILK